MSELRALSLLPFVPGGKDYVRSRRLFLELGFIELWENGGYAGLKNGDAEFILQDLDNEAFASNLMMKLVVPDLARWWDRVSELALEASYPGVRIRAPADFPWGREVHLIDMAGVCWHVGER